MFLTPWVQRLIAINVIVFFVAGTMPPIYNAWVLVPQFVLYRPWTLVTYMFLHGGFWHLFLNMLGLFFFGPRLEARLGGRGFLNLYFLSGLGGALFSFLPPMAPVVGASGAVFGVLLGFARYWPDESIYIWGIVPVQARILIIFLAAYSLYAGLGGANDGVAHFAHLGGFAGGFLYLRWHDRKHRARRVERRNSFYKATGAPDIESRRKWEAIPLDELHELNRGEVEVLLEKVRSLGIRSLTPDERAFLDRMAR